VEVADSSYPIRSGETPRGPGGAGIDLDRIVRPAARRAEVDRDPRRAGDVAACGVPVVHGPMPATRVGRPPYRGATDAGSAVDEFSAMAEAGIFPRLGITPGGESALPPGRRRPIPRAPTGEHCPWPAVAR
jgi:hypothetical protein